jgi:hypothetical protein
MLRMRGGPTRACNHPHPRPPIIVVALTSLLWDAAGFFSRTTTAGTFWSRHELVELRQTFTITSRNREGGIDPWSR